jgi:hypothetical protein
MSGGLWSENGITTLERVLGSEMAPPGPPVFGAALFRFLRCARRGPVYVVGATIGGGPALAKFCCALGCVESCRSRSRDAWVARREDVVGVSAVGTGLDLAASEIAQECCEGIETEAHGVKGRE